MGEGTFGTVVKAVNLLTNETVAIKLIRSPFENKYIARQTLREVKLLRELTEMAENGRFTNQLLDIILPENVFRDGNNE